MTTDERRRSQRTGSSQRCSLQIEGQRLSGAMVDISETGAGVVLYRLPAGLRITSGMQLTLSSEQGEGAPAGEPRGARVVWVDAVTGGRRLGLAFDDD